MNEIKIALTDETLERLNLIKDIVNHRRDGDELTIENIVKGSLYFYLNRFFTERVCENEIESVIPLGSFGELSNTILEYMEKNNITYSYMANEIQVTRSTISKILHNQKQPSLDLFIRIWVWLGCPPIHELLVRTNNVHTHQEEFHI